MKIPIAQINQIHFPLSQSINEKKICLKSMEMKCKRFGSIG